MKTDLNPEDRNRIEQEAFKRYPDGEDIDLNWHYRTVFVSSAEYATIYEREQQAKKIDRLTHYLKVAEELNELRHKKIQQLEAERSELQSLLGDILAAHDQFGEITYLVDRIKNSLKTK